MDILEAKKIWSEVKAELRSTIPDHAFYTWIDTMDAAGFEHNTFSLITVHALAVQIVRQTYFTKLNEAFQKILGKEVEITITYDDDLAQKYEQEKRKEKNRESKKPRSIVQEETPESKAMENLSQMQSFANLNLKFKFENFVVGENSRFAHALAYSVAQNPAKKYNPLFIYGGSGLGKTHLMQAIGHYIIFNKPKLKVRYVKTEEYVTDFINSINPMQKTKGKKSADAEFRDKYRNIDVLLMDDIQFLESKTQTMTAVFHTFDDLLNRNKQIVITSDRLPKDIPTLPDRLRTRFEMGIVTDITPPDFETRVAILQNLANQISLEADFSVFEYIANNFVNNVRELEGAFNKVTAYASIEQAPVTLEFAKKVLNCESLKKAITVEDVAKATADYYGVSISDFKSSARSQKISASRHVAVYLAREITEKSFESIAEFFNKKHTTMLYSYEKIKDELKVSKELERAVADIKNSLKE
uniref:chromosomal replication initiator protein DnaA n=1 Tax=Candidatus Scatousia sp. TaxID=3085663 RepID=UPI004028CB7F